MKGETAGPASPAFLDGFRRGAGGADGRALARGGLGSGERGGGEGGRGLLTLAGAVLWACLVLAGVSQAQERPLALRLAAPGEVQELVLQDGSVLYGQVVALGDPLTFRLVSGAEVEVRLAQVKALNTAPGEVVRGEYWPPDPNETRLFFGPTARTLPKGRGYLAVYEVVMPFLAFGFSDALTLSAGTPLIFGGGGSRPFWIAPKLRVWQGAGASALAAGVLLFAVEEDRFGILYGVGTRTWRSSALTVGIGYGFWNDRLAKAPAVMVGGERRLGRGLKIVSENYLLPEGEGWLLSAGPRFFGRRLSADLGLVVPLGMGSTVAVPLVNFVWNF